MHTYRDHILAITAGLIAGMAGAAIGGPVIGFAGLAGVFLSIEVVSSQKGAGSVWGHSDIRNRIAQAISAAASIELERVRPVRIGALSQSLHADTIKTRIAHQTFDAMTPIEWAPHCAICKDWRVPMVYTQINGDLTLCADCYSRDRDHRYCWKPIGFTPYTGDTIRLEEIHR